MKSVKRMTSATFLVLIAASSLGLTGLAANASANSIANSAYQQTNLVSDIPGLAVHTDPNLRNSWGTSTGPGLPIWVSDNHAGAATLYDGQGNPQPGPGNQQLVVSIPAPPSAGPGRRGAPGRHGVQPNAGWFRGIQERRVAPARFLFATEDGTIAGWNPPSIPPTRSAPWTGPPSPTSAGDRGAVYKGLALVNTPAGKFLYATNFRFGTIEVFDSNFHLVNSFTDPTVPAGFAPFGIHNIGGNLYVTFAKQDAAKQDDDAGPGNGFVDVFSPNGNLLQRLASQGRLNSPWAVTLAPPTFGAFGGDILVGNFGNGRINAFNPATGQFLGQLRNHGGPITISGLWGLRFPAGSLNVTPNALYFTAGPNHEADGLLGDIVPAQS